MSHGTGTNIIVGLTVISMIIASSLFAPDFLGDEIYRAHNYQPASCTVTGKLIDAYTCCERQCSGCDGSGAGLPSCQPLEVQEEAKDPDTCANSTAGCAVSQFCNNGYHCCGECCSTCCSCTRRRNSNEIVDKFIASVTDEKVFAYDDTLRQKKVDTYLKRSTRKTCTQSCYPCNCYCCSDVSSRRCYMDCASCYHSIINVIFKTVQGNIQNGSVTKGHGRSHAGAQMEIDTYSIGQTLKCYYDPNQPTIVEWNIGYSAWKWSIEGIFATLFVIGLMFLSWMGIKNSIDNSFDAWIALWFGFIFPIVLILPIGVAGRISYEGHVACMVICFVLIGLFWTPIVMIYYSHIMYNDEDDVVNCGITFLFAMIFWTIPWNILLPVGIYADNADIFKWVGTALLALNLGMWFIIPLTKKISCPRSSTSKDDSSSTHGLKKHYGGDDSDGIAMQTIEPPVDEKSSPFTYPMIYPVYGWSSAQPQPTSAPGFDDIPEDDPEDDLPPCPKYTNYSNA